MSKKENIVPLTCIFALLLLIVCDECSFSQIPDNEQVVDTNSIEDIAPDALAENKEDHENPEDYSWDGSEVIQIVLNENTITTNGAGATADGSIVTITSAGTYSISGGLADGQIIVDSKDKEIVRLILNGAYISCSSSAPVFIKKAKKTIIALAENTDNYVADGRSYIAEDSDVDEPNAAIFSKDNLTIFGNGSLTVIGNVNDGIASKDGLIIAGGTIDINAVDDGIRGKDYLVIKDGNISVNAGGDGLKSDNDADATMGYISIKYGVIDITAGGDAIQAETDVIITNGEIILTSGGGSNRWIDATTSAKGIKGVVSVIIDGGNFIIDSADDTIHSNGSVEINGDTFVISSGDDGIHADADIVINGGDINITKSYEGMESADANMTINDGNIHIVSSDDGINLAGGGDNFGMGGPPGQGGFPPQPQPQPQTSGNYYLNINGGYIVIKADGDGIDANGSIVMTDGVVIINGPTSNMNGALDHSSFKITGGFLLAAGSSGMAQAPDASSSQYSVLLNFRSTIPAGTLFHIQTSRQGDEVLSFLPSKAYQSIAFSSPELTRGATYSVFYGGSSTGTVYDGLYQDGTYTPGTKYTSFTISSIVTNAR